MNPAGTPSGLKIEHLGAAELGTGWASPRVSWKLPAGSSWQSARRFRIDETVHEWVEGSASVLVPWPGHPVGSSTRVEWSVQVRTDLGESDWSAPAWFETGLLQRSDWAASWIEPPDPRLRNEHGRPPHILQRNFSVPCRPSRARMYSTAHGIYESFLNGHRVGDHELSPGFTSYWHHLDVQTFDVIDLLVDGDNEWTVVLSDGWYRGKVGNNKDIDTFGDTTAFLGQLQLDDRIVGTGADWMGRVGVVLAADLMDGQVEDRRTAPGRWSPVTVVEGGAARLTASPAPPSRRVEEIRPVSVHRLDEHRQVVDLGQNISGWVRLSRLGSAGTEVSLVFGESLDDNGDVTQEHLCFGQLRLHQADRIISAGFPDDIFEPRHTTHGFQYVSFRGLTDDLGIDDVTGVVVHTDLRRTGAFRCSDRRLERLHEIVDWSFRGNACEIPTDCPQRERSGWTGDWQVFQPTASLMYDVAGFSRKWLRSLAADQLPNGCLTNMAPEPRRARSAVDDPRWTGMMGSAGWGDAVVLVPWQLHAAYGDLEVLEAMWPNMVRWLEYATTQARSRRHQSRVARSAEPLPHEEFLWDSGWHWGEWCEPGEPAEPFWQADQGHVATAYLHLSARTMAQIALLTGRNDEVARYRDLADRALGAWRAEYLDADGRLTVDTQATHVRALAFDLVPADLRAATARRLVELVHGAGTHLSTGFLATPLLLPTLADAGYVDLAFDLLFQDTPPSWLTMVERGATTVWENWEGIDAEGRAHDSLNHYSKGAVVSFLYTHVAGIRLLDDHPGYRHFRVQPVPGHRLQWVDAYHDSPYGRISSAWSIADDRFELRVVVPPGTSADVVLPDGSHHEQGAGSAVYSCPFRG